VHGRGEGARDVGRGVFPAQHDVGVADRLQEQRLPVGTGEVTGPGWATVMEPVVWPFRTGNAPPLDTGPPTVSLLPALGWLPPLLKHWYTAVASAEQETLAVVSVLPSPASLNEHTNWPLSLMVALALMKCGLSAWAAGTTANTPTSTTPANRCTGPRGNR
jgi:hypothetical protein